MGTFIWRMSTHNNENISTCHKWFPRALKVQMLRSSKSSREYSEQLLPEPLSTTCKQRSTIMSLYS